MVSSKWSYVWGTSRVLFISPPPGPCLSTLSFKNNSEAISVFTLSGLHWYILMILGYTFLCIFQSPLVCSDLSESTDLCVLLSSAPECLHHRWWLKFEQMNKQINEEEKQLYYDKDLDCNSQETQEHGFFLSFVPFSRWIVHVIGWLCSKFGHAGNTVCPMNCSSLLLGHVAVFLVNSNPSMAAEE